MNKPVINTGSPSADQVLLSQIFNAIPQAVFWKDCNGVYLGCNAVFARAAGLSSPDEVVGKTDGELPWPPAAAEAYRADDREVIGHNHPKRHIVEQLHRADGELIWVDTTKIPLTDAADRPYGVLGVYEDITERKRTEEALTKRLVALTQPLAAAEIAFDEMFNLDELQKIQDAFAGATGVASVITRPDGVPLTRPSNFCQLCINVIRKTEKGLHNCICSDAIIGRHNPAGPIVQPCLSGGLWDAGASITVGGRHVANWLIGQVKNEKTDEGKMLAYAREIGADEAEFRQALAQVSVMSLERFQKISQALFLIASELSLKAYQNIQQARALTARRKSEEELRASEEQQRHLLNHLAAGVVVHGPDTSILFSNQQASRLLGLSADQMQGKAAMDPAWRFVYEDGGPMPEAEYPVNQVLATLQPLQEFVVGVVRPATNDQVWVLVNAFPEMDAAGNLVQIVVTFVDITRREEAERELRQHRENLEAIVAERTRELAESRSAAISLLQDANEQRDRAEQALAALRQNERQLREAVQKTEAANRELEAFSYSVSHDLRAPLRHITGFMQLLLNEMGSGGNAKAVHYGEVISAAAKRMGALIDDLLSFSRAGRVQMQVMPVSLAELVAECRTDLETEARGRVVKWEIGDLPQVMADPALLRQVLANLLGNAVKYTRHRPVATIAVSATREENEVIVCVRDNGAGFDMKYADKLFGVFQRLHAEAEFEGTGIGLANVQRILARHHGRIWAEAEVGQGAAFWFSLPAAAGGGL